MTPAVAFTAGSTLAASGVVLAQDLAADSSNITIVTIFGFGSAVIGWLVHREAQDRKADQKQRDLDTEHRRLADVRRESELAAARTEAKAEREENRRLYERFIRLAHAVDPNLYPFPKENPP